MQKILFTITAILTLHCLATAQKEWTVPDNEKENISIVTFSQEMENDGQKIYNGSCKSCHGNPTKEDYVPLLPSPGDIASVDFQKQTDGELFYKIKAGRAVMPKFENSLDQEEIWQLVAYIRSFNENYEQPKPDLTNIDIPNIKLQLSFDDNVDKLVVKTFDENKVPMLDVNVKAYIKGDFGNFLLGKSKCNELGIAYFDVDSKIPGDEKGQLEIIVKASKGYGAASVTQKIVMTEPTTYVSPIEGRHLWSVAKKAPYWLIATFLLMVIGIWGVIAYIIAGLIKL